MPGGLPPQFAVGDLVHSPISPAWSTLVWNRFSSHENTEMVTQNARLLSGVHLETRFVSRRLSPSLVLDFPPFVLRLILFPCRLSLKLPQNLNCGRRHRLNPRGSVAVLTCYITAHMRDVTPAACVKLPRAEEARC